MEHDALRVLHDLIARISGPMSFRLVLQPAMAIAMAVVAGLKDARTGKPPYFLAPFGAGAADWQMLKDGWKSVGRVFLLAVALDLVYQWIVARFVYPGEAIIVAIVLAIIPYLLVRGLVTRVARRRHPGRPTTTP